MLKIIKGNSFRRGFSVFRFVLSLLVVVPLISVPVVAENNVEETNINVRLNDELAIALLNNSTEAQEITELSIDADPDDTLYTNSMVTRVSANTGAPYSLTVETSSSVTALTQAGVTTQIVGTVNDNVTATTMASNSWGISIDATNFSKVPENGNPKTIKTSRITSASGYEDTEVTFGVKVNANVVNGDYINTVIFSAVVPDA